MPVGLTSMFLVKKLYLSGRVLMPGISCKKFGYYESTIQIQS